MTKIGSVTGNIIGVSKATLRAADTGESQTSDAVCIHDDAEMSAAGSLGEASAAE